MLSLSLIIISISWFIFFICKREKNSKVETCYMSYDSHEVEPELRRHVNDHSPDYISHRIRFKNAQKIIKTPYLQSHYYSNHKLAKSIYGVSVCWKTLHIINIICLLVREIQQCLILLGARLEANIGHFMYPSASDSRISFTIGIQSNS